MKQDQRLEWLLTVFALAFLDESFILDVFMADLAVEPCPMKRGKTKSNQISVT